MQHILDYKVCSVLACYRRESFSREMRMKTNLDIQNGIP